MASSPASIAGLFCGSICTSRHHILKRGLSTVVGLRPYRTRRGGGLRPQKDSTIEESTISSSPKIWSHVAAKEIPIIVL
jgi:hypothetical protein